MAEILEPDSRVIQKKLFILRHGSKFPASDGYAVWLRYLARVLSSATFTIFIDSSSTPDLHKKVVAISVFSKVGILTFGRECFECATETKLFRPIGNSTEIFVICGRRVKNTHDVRDGGRT